MLPFRLDDFYSSSQREDTLYITPYDANTAPDDSSTKENKDKDIVDDTDQDQLEGNAAVVPFQEDDSNNSKQSPNGGASMFGRPALGTNQATDEHGNPVTVHQNTNPFNGQTIFFPGGDDGEEEEEECYRERPDGPCKPRPEEPFGVPQPQSPSVSVAPSGRE